MYGATGDTWYDNMDICSNGNYVITGKSQDTNMKGSAFFPRFLRYYIDDQPQWNWQWSGFQVDRQDMTPKFSDDCGLLAIGSWLSLSNAFVFERPYLTFLDLSDKFNPVRKGTKIVTMHQDEILQFNPGSLAWDSSENLYFAVEDWVRSNFVIGKIGFDASGEPVVEWKRVVDSTGFDEGGLGVALTSNQAIITGHENDFDLGVFVFDHAGTFLRAWGNYTPNKASSRSINFPKVLTAADSRQVLMGFCPDTALPKLRLVRFYDYALPVTPPDVQVFVATVATPKVIPFDFLAVDENIVYGVFGGAHRVLRADSDSYVFSADLGLGTLKIWPLTKSIHTRVLGAKIKNVSTDAFPKLPIEGYYFGMTKNYHGYSSCGNSMQKAHDQSNTFHTAYKHTMKSTKSCLRPDPTLTVTETNLAREANTLQNWNWINNESMYSVVLMIGSNYPSDGLWTPVYKRTNYKEKWCTVNANQEFVFPTSQDITILPDQVYEIGSGPSTLLFNDFDYGPIPICTNKADFWNYAYTVLPALPSSVTATFDEVENKFVYFTDDLTLNAVSQYTFSITGKMKNIFCATESFVLTIVNCSLVTWDNSLTHPPLETSVLRAEKLEYFFKLPALPHSNSPYCGEIQVSISDVGLENLFAEIQEFNDPVLGQGYKFTCDPKEDRFADFYQLQVVQKLVKYPTAQLMTILPLTVLPCEVLELSIDDVGDFFEYLVQGPEIVIEPNTTMIPACQNPQRFTLELTKPKTAEAKAMVDDFVRFDEDTGEIEIYTTSNDFAGVWEFNVFVSIREESGNLYGYMESEVKKFAVSILPLNSLMIFNNPPEFKSTLQGASLPVGKGLELKLPDYFDPEGDEVILKVDVGKAASFLMFNKEEQKFVILPGVTTNAVAGIYTITVNLQDKNPQKAMSQKYTFTVLITPNLFNFTSSEQKKWEYNQERPIPTIKKIDMLGRVTIVWSKLMKPELNFTLIEEGKFEFLEGGETIVKPNIELKIVPGTNFEPAFVKKLNEFSWKIVKNTPEELLLQLNFTYPHFISISSTKDDLQITFLEQHAFHGAKHAYDRTADSDKKGFASVKCRWNC